MINIVIIHDVGYKDVDYMMRQIDYVARTGKIFDNEFTVLLQENSELEPVMKEAGLPYEVVKELPVVPQALIAFSNWEDNSTTLEPLMNQWKACLPVFPFKIKWS